MYIRSPLNYTGGKYKLLNYIIPLIPKGTNQFVDLFAGGLNVGINIKANTIYVNDRLTYLIDLYKYLSEHSTEDIVSEVKNRISEYNLSNQNQESYNTFRDHYNQTKNPLDLFILSCFSFNNQMRFNNDFEFNMPFGLRSYNDQIESNLRRFCDVLHSRKFIFSSKDFRFFNYSVLNRDDVVYCDPPYLLSTATYNDGQRGFGDWNEADDRDLFTILNDLNTNGIKFILSNVTEHRGEKNEELLSFAKDYYLTEINKTYKDCSYNLKDRYSETKEVLITNFKPEIIVVKKNRLF